MSTNSNSHSPTAANAATRTRDQPKRRCAHADEPEVLNRLRSDGLSVRRSNGTIGTREYVIDLGRAAD